VASLPLRPARTIGERMLKVDHAGEHGAICIYRAQRWVARWRAPQMTEEIEHFLSHEQRHRALFETELRRRGIRRCRSFHLCGLGGLVLGFLTGLAGERAISLTTEAVESVVLAHLAHQVTLLREADPAAAAVIEGIVSDEQEHHDSSAGKLGEAAFIDALVRPVVRRATEAVIWLGMRLP
jgi:ubiquinone biosynthesis monooxygenase Coq7